MKKYQIHLEDWQRILMGDVPPSFLIEVILRSVIIYFILIASMRVMGRRMASQLSRIEMAAMVSLAAAIGVPMQAPDRGILPAVVIAIIVVAVERIISYYAAKNEKFEEMSQDDLDVLVEDSVLKVDRMKRTRITKDRLCAHLRSKGLTNLGAVKRLYLEANGSFSLVKDTDPKPGLNILPEWDTDFIRELKVTDIEVCRNCGKERSEQSENNRCSNCGETEWDHAVIDVKQARRKREETAPEYA